MVAVTQIDAEGKAHLDFHCNEYGTLLKSIPLMESWDVVSRVHRIQSCKSFLYSWLLLEQMPLCSYQSRFTYTNDHVKEIFLHAWQNEFFSLSPLESRGCLLTNGLKDEASCFLLRHAIWPQSDFLPFYKFGNVLKNKNSVFCIESPQLLNRDFWSCRVFKHSWKFVSFE